jgi:hypothetical protein
VYRSRTLASNRAWSFLRHWFDKGTIQEIIEPLLPTGLWFARVKTDDGGVRTVYFRRVKYRWRFVRGEGDDVTRSVSEA